MAFYKEVSKGDKFQFIADNIDLLDSYDLRDLFTLTFGKRMSKELSMYCAGVKLRYFGYGTYEFDENESIADNKAEFIAMLAKKKITLLECRLIYPFQNVFSSHFRKTDKPTQFKIGDMSNWSFLSLMRYIVMGEWDNSNSWAIDFSEKNKIQDKSFLTFNLENVSVKQFLNGRIDIKGLNNDQQSRLDNLFVIADKFQAR